MHAVTAKRWVNAAAFAVLLAVNGLANALPIFGVRTEDVSRTYDNLFTPAPLTFAIWGVIYALTAGFVLFQAGAFDRVGERSGQVAERAGGWFAAGCVFNAAWMLSWHAKRLGLCVLLMAGLLITLIVLTARLAPFAEGWKERWLVRAPFSLYMGWITVATIAGMSAWLTQRRWDGWGMAPQAWTVIMLIVGAVIAGWTTLARRDGLCALAVVWGYAGIILRHVTGEGGFGGAYPAVICTAAVAAAAVAGACCLSRRYVSIR